MECPDQVADLPPGLAHWAEAVHNVPSPEPPVPVLQVPTQRLDRPGPASLWVSFSFVKLGKDNMAINTFVLKAQCMCSPPSRWRGLLLFFSLPSTVTFLLVLMGLSPISPCEHSLNCFLSKLSDPWSSSLGTGSLIIRRDTPTRKPSKHILSGPQGMKVFQLQACVSMVSTC